jgi:photosystem II stability/assembly factor-like uncharacterized protein
MRHLFRVSMILVFMAACRKGNDNNGSHPPVTCLEQTFLTTNIPEGLQAIFFINGKDGFVGGVNGGLYKTVDSAKSWTALNSTVQVPIHDILFLNPLTGFAVGGSSGCGGTGCIPYGGVILRTLDGGQTWTKVFTTSEKLEMYSLFFVNNTVGYCAGGNEILKTIDGGQTWSEYIINGLGGIIMQIAFTDPQHGYAVCLFDKILKTENGGTTWEISSPNQNNGYYSVSASNGAIYVSGQGKVIKSVNGGASWSALGNSPIDIFAIHFISKNTGYAFGRGNYSGGDFGYNYGSFYCTNDGGNSWNGGGDLKEVGLIDAVSFPTNEIGYAVSGNKVIRVQ